MRTTILFLWLLAATAQAQFVPFGFLGTNGGVPAAGGGGSATNWIDVATFADTDSDAFATATSDNFDVVTFASSGTVDKLRVYIGTQFNPSDVKMALYSSGGTLLGNGVASVSGTGYLVVALGTPASVTATTYYIAWESSNAEVAYRYKSGTGAFEFGATAYASFPASPKPSTTPFSRSYAVSAELITP